MYRMPLNTSLRLCGRLLHQPNLRCGQFPAMRNKWNVKESLCQLQKEQIKDDSIPVKDQKMLPVSKSPSSDIENYDELIFSDLCEVGLNQFETKTPATVGSNQMKCPDPHQRIVELPLPTDGHYFYEKNWFPSHSGEGEYDSIVSKQLYPKLKANTAASDKCKSNVINVIPKNNAKRSSKIKISSKAADAIKKSPSKPSKEIINKSVMDKSKSEGNPINVMPKNSSEGNSKIKTLNRVANSIKTTSKISKEIVDHSSRNKSKSKENPVSVMTKNIGEGNPQTKTSSKTAHAVNKEIDKIARDMYRNKNFITNLKSYVRICVNTNFVGRAHSALVYHRCKSSTQAKYKITDVEVYDTILSGWAQKGRLEAIKELFCHLKEDGLSPSVNSYGAYLECLSRKNMHNSPEVKKIISAMENNGITLSDILKKSKFIGDQRERLVEIIQHVKPDVLAEAKVSIKRYKCKLLEELNVAEKSKSGWNLTNHNLDKLLTKDEICKMLVSQVEMENSHALKLKSVDAPCNPSEEVLRLRKIVKNCEEEWRKKLDETFKKRIKTMWEKVQFDRHLSLFNYLISVEPGIIVNIMMEEIRYLAENCEHYSLNLRVLHKNIGTQVMNQHFLRLKKDNKITDKMINIYHKYVQYVTQPNSQYLPGEYWEMLKSREMTGPTIDIADVSWPYPVLVGVGEFLYDILFGIKFNVNLMKPKCKTLMILPAFNTMYVSEGKKLYIQVRVAPNLCKLYREAKLEDIPFDITLVPTLCPPRPWIRSDAGGLLLRTIPFIRLPPYAHQQNFAFNQVPVEQLYPCFDSLNMLTLCPWIVNKPVLDLIIKVFKEHGCEELDVPVNPLSLPTPPKIKYNASEKEKHEKFFLEKQKREVTSLWYDCLYKLTIANHFRDKMFWFPHNLDFRGRVYPTPPHFNHLGSDLVRSILLFAEGKPLGKHGLDWLKIHLINLTGFKKRESQQERLRYANEMLPEILDSADLPFSGNQWWKTSDEPWQTLACCKEIANVVRSPNPEEFLSHFPIHQDGSCNGLQHYAALGRDELGAKEVNLQSADTPSDVYSGVAALVEKERQIDAANGNEIAKSLDGFIKRKVVKQTVMTFVYGVTKYGAKLQILKQLKDIPDFPEEKCKPAATYVMMKTFASIEKMFTATREIQNWFTECAKSITKISGEPVEWVTPLGLPVIQPYHRETSVRGVSEFILNGKGLQTNYKSTFDISQPPNVMKQKNAFAPNFIHSLDSCHMMLTALHCQRKGISFVSVHDCFWTHASTVEIMNRVCREQFVALHSERILEDLSDFFLKKYGNIQSKSKKSRKAEDVFELQSVLKDVPQKGTFKLENVLDSVYFFS